MNKFLLVVIIFLLILVFLTFVVGKDIQEEEFAFVEEVITPAYDVSYESEALYLSEIIQAVPKKIKKEEPKFCNLKSKESANKNVIINEIAWMGTKDDYKNEWFEIKNISKKEIDLFDWQIIDKAQQIQIDLPKYILQPKKILLFERTEETLPGIKADFLYEGTLSNSNEALYLFNNNCEVVDKVIADPSWPAGENKDKKSMERHVDFTWHTYRGSGQFDGGFSVQGSPRRENSLPPPIEL